MRYFLLALSFTISTAFVFFAFVIIFNNFLVEIFGGHYLDAGFYLYLGFVILGPVSMISFKIMRGMELERLRKRRLRETADEFAIYHKYNCKLPFVKKVERFDDIAAFVIDKNRWVIWYEKDGNIEITIPSKYNGNVQFRNFRLTELISLTDLKGQVN